MKKEHALRTMALAVAATQLGSFYAPVAAAQPMLEEVVVTARKRTESLMDSPISVVAVQGESLDQQGITNLEQLSSQVPGLKIGRTAQTSSIFIRGIGSGATSTSFEQSAGMYVDGVYQSRSRAFTQTLVDLDRIEVLRGPQGILFGKNTIAGAIKVETASPVVGDPFEATFTVDVEPEYSSARGTAVLSGSVSDTVALRGAFRYQETDGYVENNLRNADEQEKEDTLARVSLVWEPTETIGVVAKLSTVEMEGRGKEIVNTIVDTSYLEDPGNLGVTSYIGTIAALAVPGYEESSGSKEYESWVGNEGYLPGGTDVEKIESDQLSLKVEWDIGSYQLSSLTGYTDFVFAQDHDLDFHGGNVVHGDGSEENELWSQEFRISSSFDGPINFLAGIYYEDQELKSGGSTFSDGTLNGVFGKLPASALSPALPPIPLEQFGFNSLWNGTLLSLQDPGFAPLAGSEVSSIFRTGEGRVTQDTETIAIFAEFTWDLTDSLTLEIGGRYSEDTKEVFKAIALGRGGPGGNEILIASDGSLTEAGQNDPQNSALVAAIWGGLLSTYPHEQDLKREEDHFDPSARLLWNPTEDTMIFASYVEGYKSGGFNRSPDTANSDGTPGPGSEFEDEQATSYELGIRSTLMDGRARLGATLFYTEVEDLQVTSFNGLSFLVGNAAEMTSQGVELEGQIAATDGLTLGVSLAYLKAEYDSFEGAKCTLAQTAATEGTCRQDLSGETTPNAPEWSASLYADYRRPLGEGVELQLRADGGYKSEFYLDAGLDDNALQDDYFKINARIGIASMSGSWELALYGRNLTDETTYSFAGDPPLSAGITAGWIEEPRIVGLQGIYRFQ
jgi:iron complex outermembrane recepter protein